MSSNVSLPHAPVGFFPRIEDRPRLHRDISEARKDDAEAAWIFLCRSRRQGLLEFY
jgi:hypothetical protein